MPDSQYNVLINLAGSVNPTVNLSISKVTQQLMALQKQVLSVNRSLTTMGRGGGGGGFRGGMSIPFGGLLGALGGFFAVSRLTSAMNDAIKLSKQNEQIQEATLVLLENQRAIRHQNVQLARQDLQLLTAQAEQLQQQTGLYKNIFERGSFILAQTHRTPQEIQRINESMANLLAAQRMSGMSVEKLPELYQAVGKAIETGMARNLNSVGVILTSMEKRQLMMHARVGDTADNIKIVLKAIDRTYGGMAAMRMHTLLGQTELGWNNMILAVEKMGDALKPIQQRLTIILGEIIPLIAPIVIKLANYIDAALKSHMRDISEWVSVMKKTVMPIMLDWIDKGWKPLIQLVDNFKEHSSWLIPFLVGFAGTMAVVTAAVWAFNTALYFNPFIWWTVAIAALIGMLVALVMNFDNVKKAALGFAEWALGTDRIAPGARRFHGGPMPGTKEGQFQEGFFPSWWKKIDDYMDQLFAKWRKKLAEWLADMKKMVGDWLETVKQTGITWAQDFAKKFVDPIVEGMKKIGNAFQTWLLDPLKAWGDAWNNFLQHLPFGGATGTQNISTGAQGVIPLPGGGKGHIYNPMPAAPIGPSGGFTNVNVVGPDTAPARYLNPSGMWPGPVSRQFGGTTFGWLYPPGLKPQKIARFPTAFQGAEAQFALLGGKHYAGRTVESVIDEWSGGSYGPANVASYVKSLGLPPGTRITREFLASSAGIEFAKKQAQFETGRSYAKLGLSQADWALAQRGGLSGSDLIAQRGTAASVPDITLNYNVTHNHNGGLADINQIEAVHRRHVDALSRILEDSIYQNNRKSFDQGSEAL